MKKLTNNKGFSLIELIIVIAIMAVLVAIIAPNLTKYLGSSKKNTDAKNADEIASQIQTCITDYETTNGYLGSYSLSWGANGLTAGSNTSFEDIVNSAITSSTQSKEVTSGNTQYAAATITPKDATDLSKGYTVSVTLGNATKSK